MRDKHMKQLMKDRRFRTLMKDKKFKSRLEKKSGNKFLVLLMIIGLIYAYTLYKNIILLGIIIVLVFVLIK
ncbi:MAG: hypothetical protein KJ674_02525 [Nanoarchaeota archaeon]|nr:hypothetical protein [Nanoarchaeota archaeon]